MVDLQTNLLAVVSEINTKLDDLKFAPRDGFINITGDVDGVPADISGEYETIKELAIRHPCSSRRRDAVLRSTAV